MNKVSTQLYVLTCTYSVIFMYTNACTYITLLYVCTQNIEPIAIQLDFG